MTALPPRTARRARNVLLGSTALVAAAAAMPAHAQMQIAAPRDGGAITGAGTESVENNTPAGGGIYLQTVAAPITFTGVTIANTTGAGPTAGQAANALGLVSASPSPQAIVLNGSNSFSTTRPGGTAFRAQSLNSDISVTMNGGSQSFSGTDGLHLRALDAVSVVNTGGPLGITVTGQYGVYNRANNLGSTLNLGTANITATAGTGVYAYGYTGANVMTGGGIIAAEAGIAAYSEGLVTIVSGSTITGNGNSNATSIGLGGYGQSANARVEITSNAAISAVYKGIYLENQAGLAGNVIRANADITAISAGIDTGSSTGTDIHVGAGATIQGGTNGIARSSAGTTYNSGTILGGVGITSTVASTIENSGLIQGTSTAVNFLAGGSLTNHVGASITSGGAGINVAGLPGTVENRGTISAGNAAAIMLSASGTATNYGTINASGSNSTGLRSTGAATTLDNRGAITANIGIRTDASGSTLNNSGTINATSFAIYVPSGSATLTNSGTVNGSIGATLNGGGSVTNTGTMIGVSYGITSAGAATTVVNSGTISGGSGAMSLSSFDDTVTLNSGSTTTGSISLGNGNDTLNIMTGATFGTLGGGNGSDTLALGGTTTGTLNLATTSAFEILKKTGTGTWTLNGASASPGMTITAGNGTPSGTLVFNGSGLTGAIVVNGAIIRATSAGGFGTGTITTLDPTIQYGATGTYSNAIVLASTDPLNDPTRLEADAGIIATLTGNITQQTGPGQSLVIGGLGTIALTGTGSWTNGTTIEAGATLVTRASSVSAGAITNNGTLVFDNSGNGAFNLTISGTGDLTKRGSDSITIAGNNTYTGTTTIEAGTLTIGSLNTIATSSAVALTGNTAVLNLGSNVGGAAINNLSGVTGSSVMLAGASYTLANGTNTVFAGTISSASPFDAARRITKTGTGTLTLSGDTSGLQVGVAINQGAIVLTDTATLSHAAIVSVASSASFDISGITGATSSVRDLIGNGTILLGDKTLVVIAGGTASSPLPSVFSGTMTGTGGFQLAGGSLTLAATMGYSGATRIDTGATLTLANGASLLNSDLAIAGTLAVSGTGSALHSISGTGAVTLGGNTLQIADGGTFGGVMSNGALRLTGGELVLTGDNLLTAVTLDGGDLTIGNGDPTPATTGTWNIVLTNGTLTANRGVDGSTLNLSGLSGAGNFVQAGLGTTRMEEATYTGTTTVEAGTLQLDGSNALADFGRMIVNAGGTLRLNTSGISEVIGSIEGDGTIDLDTHELLLTRGGDFSGTITDAAQAGAPGTLIIGSDASLLFTGTATYGGDTVVFGDLAIGDGGTHGTVAGRIQLVSGTLTTNRSDALTINGLAGIGDFTQAGAGVTSLTGAHGYSGSVTIADGTLALLDGNALASSRSVALTTIGATLDATGATGGAIIGKLSGVAGSVVRYGDAGMEVRLQTPGNSIFAGGFDDASSAPIAPTMQLTGFSTGTLTLTGQSNMRAVGVEGTTLALSGTGSLGTGTGVKIGNGGRLDLSGLADPNYSIGDLTGNGGTILLGGTTLEITDGTSGSFAGNVQGSGGMHLSGGAITLSGLNELTGDTVIDSGTSLTLAGGGSLSSSKVVVDGTLAVANAATVSELAGGGTVMLTSGTLYINGNGGESGFTGIVAELDGANPRDLVINSGHQTVSQDWTYTGRTVLAGNAAMTIGDGSTNGSLASAILMSGGTLTADRSDTMTIHGLFGSGTLLQAGSGETILGSSSQVGPTFQGDAIVANGTLTLTNPDRLLFTSIALTGANAVLNTGNDLQLVMTDRLSGVAGSTINIAGNGLMVTNTVATTFDGVLNSVPNADLFYVNGLSKSGTGALTLTGRSTLSDLVLQQGVVALTGTAALGDSARVRMDGGTFDLSGLTTGALAIGALKDGNSDSLVNLGGTMLTINGNDGEFYGIIQGSGGLVVTNWQRLEGVNTYSGDTVIDAGATLTLGGMGSIAHSAVVANGVFDLRDVYDGDNDIVPDVTIANLSGAGTVLLSDSTLILGGNDLAGTFSGTFSGGAGLVQKDGTGTWTLSGANTLTVLTVNQGTVALAGNGSLGDDAVIDLSSSLDISGITAAETRIADLRGQGAVDLGAKTLVLTNGAQGYDGVMTGTGGVRIAGGFGTFSQTQLYTGTTTVDAGSRLYLVGIDGGLSGAAQVDGTLDLSLHAGAPVIGGLSGTGTVLLRPDRDLTLNGGGSFSGSIHGGAGMVFAAGTSTLRGANDYAGTTTIDAAATLVLAGTGTVGTGAVIANGELDLSGAAAGVRIANLSGTGTVALGTNTLTLGWNDQDSLFGGVASGTGGIIKIGTGTLTLSGTNSYSGLTQVAEGTLRLGAAGVLADDSTLEVLNGATLDMNGFDETVAAFTIQGNLTGAGTLTAARYNFLGGTIDHDLGGGAIYQSSGTTLLNGQSAGSAVHVDGGTLVLGADDRLADTATVTVLAGATLDLQGYDDTVGSLAVAGTLNGTGTLTASTYTLDGALVRGNLGTGTLTQRSGISELDGAAAAGTVNVIGGTLQLGASDRLADTAAVGVAAGTTLDLRGFDDTVGTLALAGALSGTGTLTAATYTLDSATVDANLGTGTLTQRSGTSRLNGTAAAGMVNLTGGTLRLGAADRLADAAAATVASGTVLDLQGFDETVGSLVLAGALSGTGTLTAATYTLDNAAVNANLGSGTLDQRLGISLLNGAAAAGTVNLTGGTLRLGAADRLADAAAVSVAAHATLDLQGYGDRVESLALAGTLAGTGTLGANTYRLDGAAVNANLGTGTLTQHSGISTLNGTAAAAAVNLDAGTLRLGGANRLADAAAVRVANGTTLDLQGFSDTIGTLALAGTLAGTGTLTAARYTLNGATVEANLGTGTLTQNSGTSVLRGSFAGSAAQIDGGTLAFERATAATYAGTVSGTGTLAQTGSGTLTFSGNSAGFAGTTDVSAGGLTVTGQLGGSVTVSAGTLAGAGSIGGTVSIADGAHLAGAYGSTLSMGALELSSGSILDVSLSQASDAALFDVNGNLTLDGTLNVTALAGFGSGIYRLFSYGGTLADNGLALGTVNGAASDGLTVQTGSAGQVNLVSSAGVALAFWDGGAAANPFNGRVEGGAGTWSAAAPNWTDANGAINGAMQPVPSFAIFQGTGGAVTIDNGAGQVSASAMQFAANGYTLSGGPLALSGSQAIVRVGDGTAAGAGLTATIASALTGSAALVKTDLGTLVLTGANNYTGGTIVQAGTLIGNATSIQGSIQNAGTVVFDQASNASFGGTISGVGSNVKSGTGALTLTGASSGNWQVTAGSLVSTSALFTGNADLGAGTRLVFEQTANGSYAGTLTGTGSVLFRGGGTVLLTGNSSGFAGTTSVGAGSMFSVNGTLGGTIDVAAGGRLQGSGTAGSANVAGTIAPGNSIGTLSFTGNLAFTSGGIFEVEANAAGQSDKIVVNGTASIASGTTVSVLAANGNYAANTSYTILTAAGGLSGTFTNVTSNLAFLTPTLAYGANAVTLNLKRNTVDFITVAQTGNQSAVAPAVQALGESNDVYEAVAGLTAPEARAAFDQLAGSDHASMRASLVEDSRFLRDAMLSRGEMAGTEGLAVWGRVIGAWRDVDGSAEAQGYTRSTQGFTTGFDGSFDGHWRMGVALSYGTSEFRTGNATHKAESYQAGTSLLGSYGPVSIQLGTAYGWNAVTSQRHVAFGNVTQLLGDEYDARTLQTFGQLAVKGTIGGVDLQPFVGLAHVALFDAGVNEHGGSAALHGGGADGFNATYGSLGLKGRIGWDLGGTRLSIDGSAAARRVFGDRVPTIDLAFAGGKAFRASGIPLDRTSAAVDLGLELDLGEHIRLGVSYTGAHADRSADHGARAQLGWRF
ncbi:autotransporter-associated beta strand repeat-containing protein [Sphingomonas sp. HF-S4]|uniref:Autotransporter-associated beta strand repeat-containing protein n=1 Tax=Sphingomonas agrestis TaxID=3080540 RepID=A0ABU3Y4C0_9SPHN|nr:autotransporter-associated beta strand repeat-containing protein [Sphingomonas sp. HF-S4]MDV3456204.1 autotransporter-associated beta strand repeat-containing protein [Sphingomonas sp. HF-S4]